MTGAVLTGIAILVGLLVLPTAAGALLAADGSTCTIVGSLGNDAIQGTPGNDVICGLGGNDTISGGSGNDVIDGGPGNDVMIGGPGTDKMIGGLGLDTASFADHSCSVTATLAGLVATTTNGCANENDTITAATTENLTGGTNNDTLTGSSAPNTITGGPGADTISGGPGNDLMLGGPGADTFIGGAGLDTTSYTDHSCPVRAVLAGTAPTTGNGCANENDLVYGSTENLTGGTNNDTLTGNSAANAINGGPGTDAIITDTAATTATDTINGGSGDDGFSTKTTDVVTSGGGGSVCPLDGQVTIGCTEGAVVTNVTQQSSVSASNVASVTVRANVIDFSGTGLTKVALATSISTQPSSLDRDYFSAIRNQSQTRIRFSSNGAASGSWSSQLVLESGTTINGTWRATFSIPNPPPSFGIRLFTNGFRTAAASVVWPKGNVPFTAKTLQCISSFMSANGDAECGISGFILTTIGMPRQVPMILFDARRGMRAPNLTGLTITPSTKTGTPTISVRIRATADPGSTVSGVALGFRPPEESGRSAQPLVYVPHLFDAAFTPTSTLDETYSLSYPFDVPGSWKIGIFLSSASLTVPETNNGPSAWADYEAPEINALGLNPAISVSAGPTPLTVTKSGLGSGTVTSSPTGIDCGTTCSTTVPWGTSVTLTATPANGRSFAGWSGGCSGTTPTCTVSLTKATTVTATFARPVTLTIGKSGLGSGVITGSGGIDCGTTCSVEFPSGTQVTLSVTTDPGSSFGGWSVPGCGVASTCTLAVSSDTNIDVAFLGPLNDATAVAVGSGHTCVARSTGSVVCWGSNAHGQLGDGTTADRTTPVTVQNLNDAVAVTAGIWNSSCALRSPGSVVCWGSNEYGQLGDGTTVDRATPVAVQNLDDAIAITAGRVHTCALRSTGAVVCWGWQGEGRLGNDVSSYTKNLTPVVVNGLVDAKAIANGGDHSCALRSGGSVVCWGYNGNGQLGDDTTTDRATPVAVQNLDDAIAITAGERHTCAVRSGGSVVCWGYNGNGQLGDDTTTDRATPVAVRNLDDAIAITAGEGHTCAVRSSGSVACWGSGGGGQLGDGTQTSSATPVAVHNLTDAIAITSSWDYVCAIRAAGSVVCWGSDGSGHPPRTTPVLVGG